MPLPPKIAVDGRPLEKPRTGVGRYLASLLRHFSDATILQDVFGKSRPTFFCYFKSAVPDLASLQNPVFVKKRLRPLLGVPSNAVFTHWLLPRALRQDHCDLFFAPSYIAPLWGVRRLVLTLHDISYEAHPEWIGLSDRLFLRFVSRRAAKRASRILVPSEFSRSEIVRRYRASTGRVSVTALAADPALSDAIVSPAEERRMLEVLCPSSRFILFVGHLINRRYPLEIIGAFAAAAKAFPDLSLVLIGPDRTHPPLGIRREIERVNARLGRRAIAQTTGVNDRTLAVLYRRAACLVWPSAYEGFGLPPLEALTMGTPVITTNGSSLPEVVDRAAIRLPLPLTVPALADALGQVLSSAQLRNFLKAKAQAHVKNFSWEQTARRTLATMREALEEKR